MIANENSQLGIVLLYSSIIIGLTRYKKTFSKYNTCAEIDLVDPSDDPDEEDIEDEQLEEDPENNDVDDDDDDDEDLASREEALMQFTNFISSVIDEAH